MKKAYKKLSKRHEELERVKEVLHVTTCKKVIGEVINTKLLVKYKFFAASQKAICIKQRSVAYNYIAIFTANRSEVE